jgi:hypothetical protein
MTWPPKWRPLRSPRRSGWRASGSRRSEGRKEIAAQQGRGPPAGCRVRGRGVYRTREKKLRRSDCDPSCAVPRSDVAFLKRQRATVRGLVRATAVACGRPTRPLAGGCLHQERSPLSQCSRATLLIVLPGDDVPLLIELVVDLAGEIDRRAVNDGLRHPRTGVQSGMDMVDASQTEFQTRTRFGTSPMKLRLPISTPLVRRMS